MTRTERIEAEQRMYETSIVPTMGEVMDFINNTLRRGESPLTKQEYIDTAVKMHYANLNRHCSKQALEICTLRDEVIALRAAPSESAMEMVERIRENAVVGHKLSNSYYYLSSSEAAALLKDYAERETAALRDLMRRMRVAGTWKADSEAWYALCAEADKVLGD